MRIALLTIVTVALIVSRRPETITSPQFWAEDGTMWYAEAYNHGPLAPFGWPKAGYLQTFSRLAAALSLLVDLAYAPLVFRLAAILIQAIVPLFLISSRFEPVVPGRWVRVLLAFLVIAVPNAFEVHANVTNTYWQLALLAFLILVASPARSRGWRAFDVAFLVLAGLSGPQCLLLVPIAVACWLRERSAWSAVLLGVLLVPVTLQTASLLTTGETRVQIPLGASPIRLLEILGCQIFVGGAVGMDNYLQIFSARWRGHGWLPIVIGGAGTLLLARVFLRTPSFALRALLGFAIFILAAALGSPMVAAAPRWKALTWPGVGTRYYFIPILAYIAALLWALAADRSRLVRSLAAVALAILFLVGIPGDWRLPPLDDFHFQTEVQRFAAARPGAVVEIDIPPRGWKMTLIKR